MSHIIYNLSNIGGVELSPSFVQFAQLLPVVPCALNVPIGWADSIGNLWNCRTDCAPKKFYQTFKKGDVIPFQFQLEDKGNAVKMQPSKGWKNSHDTANYYIKAELIAADCITVYSSNVDAFCSDWWVSFDNRLGSIQTIFLDTGLLPIGQNVFSLRVSTYDSTYTLVSTLYSETFIENVCDETHVLTGRYANIDTFRNTYKQPTTYYHAATAAPTYIPTPYYSQMRVVSNMIASNFNTEFERNDNGKVLTSKHINTYDIAIIPYVPAYYAEMIANCVQSDTTLIDNVEYENISNIARNNASSLFKIDFTADKVVNISNRKCN